MDLLTQFSSAVGGMAPTGRRQHVASIPRHFIENSLRKLVKKIWVRSNGRIYIMDLLTRFSSVVGGMAPIGHHQRVEPIPRNSVENSFQKLVKNI